MFESRLSLRNLVVEKYVQACRAVALGEEDSILFFELLRDVWKTKF